MDPNQFYFLVLPLASMVFILVIVVLYYAREKSGNALAEFQLLEVLVQSMDKVNFTTALQDLYERKVIDKKSFIRMGQILEEHLSENKALNKDKLEKSA
jgi:uncharacterized protein YqgQ